MVCPCHNVHIDEPRGHRFIRDHGVSLFLVMCNSMSLNNRRQMYKKMSLKMKRLNVTPDVPKPNSKIDSNLPKIDFEKIYSPLKGNN